MKKQAAIVTKAKRGRPKKNVAPVSVPVQAKKSKKKAPQTEVIKEVEPSNGESISSSTPLCFVGKLKCAFAWLVEKIKKAL
jgi:hypothetical protein